MQRSTNQSTNRRNSNQSSHHQSQRASSNNYKFHNFVFNETNQKFCLEEQHGNKKITVLHWKSPNNGQDAKTTKNLRQSESDSKLLATNDLTSDNQDDHLDQPTTISTLQSSASFPSNGRQIVITPPQPLPLPLIPVNNSNSFNHSSSGHSSLSSWHHSFISSSLSSGSNQLNDLKNISSITTISTATPSASSDNFGMIDNLQRLPQHQGRLINHQNIKRKTIDHKSSKVFDCLEDNDTDDDDYVDSAVDDDSDDDSDDEDDLFIQTYRLRLQQRLAECIFDQRMLPQRSLEPSEDCSETLQQQPLDLSLKKSINSITADDLDSNPNPNLDIDLEQSSNSDIIDDQLMNKEQSLSMRKDSLSPSIFQLSSIKCSSPSSTSIIDDNHSSQLNPFSLQNFQSSSKQLSNELFNLNNVQADNHSTSNISDPQSDNCDHDRKPYGHSGTEEADDHLQPCFNTATSSNYRKPMDIFDALLEEEIQKFLHSSHKNSSTMRRSTLKSKHQSIANEFEFEFDKKFKHLHQEMQHKTENSLFRDDHRFFQRPSINDEFDHQQHSSSHFKHKQMLDAFESSPSTIYRTLRNQRISSSLSHRNQIRRNLEDAFKQNGFLVKTKQISDANNSAMFCKFRQLRKYTRYYLKSWHNHLPDEVNKLWKGFLPPKSEHRPQSSMMHQLDARTATTSINETNDSMNHPICGSSSIFESSLKHHFQ